jgi:glycerol-3-phosphate acyltransferase PlsY
MSLNDGGLLKYLFSAEDTNFFIFYLLFTIITIVCAYLLGSINSAIIISKTLYRDDIRKHGSGNAGLTNMLRTYGKGAAGLTLFGDIAKTAVAILISALFFGFNYVGGVSTGDGMCYIAGLFTVIGHIAPVYYKFKGGKGVLTTAVTALILSPVPFLILFAVFIAIVAVSKYVSLGSVIGAIFYPVMLRGYFAVVFSNTDRSLPGLAALATIIIAIIVVWCHRGNLQRISERTERKISFKKKPEISSAAEEKNDAEK